MASTGTKKPTKKPEQKRMWGRVIIDLRNRLNISEASKDALERENKRLKEIIRDKVRVEDEIWFEPGNKLMFTHRCLGETLTIELDHTWRIERNGRIFPSIHCLACGAHFHAKVNFNVQHTEFQPWKQSRSLPHKREETNHGHTYVEGRHSYRNKDVRM